MLPHKLETISAVEILCSENMYSFFVLVFSAPGKHPSEILFSSFAIQNEGVYDQQIVKCYLLNVHQKSQCKHTLTRKEHCLLQK